MLEKDIEARLVRGVKKLGGVCFKFVSPGNVGVPDRIAIFPGGRVIFIELKTETGRLSRAQEWKIKTMRGVGADVRVLYGPLEVSEFLEEQLEIVKETEAGRS